MSFHFFPIIVQLINFDLSKSRLDEFSTTKPGGFRGLFLRLTGSGKRGELPDDVADALSKRLKARSKQIDIGYVP